jgi:murein DD-endopeptidase MepM/ murein hydrolase activator NlpD
VSEFIRFFWHSFISGALASALSLDIAFGVAGNAIAPRSIFLDNKTAIAQSSSSPTPQELSCETPVLSRLQRHKIVSGETVASIAQKYNLLPETLIRLNSLLQNNSAPVGKEILIPPFNGVRLEVPPGATWEDLEKAYGVRADVLFEMNGCQKNPKVVFIPGVAWNTQTGTSQRNYTGLKGYPLPQTAKVGLGYGWQTNSTSGQTLFHSGVDLLAAPGTPVLAADDGVVAFVGEESTYGNLVVINRADEWQTRYAHLGTIKVKIGQQVKAGDTIGTIGTTGQPDIKEPHLHFEVRYQSPAGWVAQDPAIHLPKSATSRQ